MPIIIKSEEEIAIIREAGRVVGQVLQILARKAKQGVRGKQLDALVRKEFASRGVKPTFLGYMGYPASVCLSVNDEVVHGIPGDRELKDGDVLSIDLGATCKGFVGDAAITVGVGRISSEAERLVRTTERALYKGIEAARAGSPLGAVSHAVQTEVEGAGFSVVREYVGHGVGRAMHEDPQIPNFGSADKGPILRKGMVLAIEPMVNAGGWRTKRHEDGWTVSTLDRSLSAHFEHTIAVTDGEAEILTLP
ncbi:MAG: type I methionyl aminopeptidase [Dehalococcoidia bacterium]|jgi:methionyl aminopeptidase